MAKIEKDTSEKPLLFDLLREVSLVGYSNIKPYTDVGIEIVRINPVEVKPTAYYVLESNLNSIYNLFEEGVDLFNLLDVYETHDEKILLPPILEEHTINGQKELVLIDGQHRLFLGKQLGIESVSIIVISDCTVPSPVLPLDSWNMVVIMNDVPRIKRKYNADISKEEVSKYYRNLPGSSGERR